MFRAQGLVRERGLDQGLAGVEIAFHAQGFHRRFPAAQLMLLEGGNPALGKQDDCAGARQAFCSATDGPAGVAGGSRPGP